MVTSPRVSLCRAARPSVEVGKGPLAAVTVGVVQFVERVAMRGGPTAEQGRAAFLAGLGGEHDVGKTRRTTAALGILGGGGHRLAHAAVPQ